MEDFVSFAQVPIFEQSQGIPFDFSEFTMNVSLPKTSLATPSCATLEEWTENEEEKHYLKLIRV
jgi:hypothetical protein